PTPAPTIGGVSPNSGPLAGGTPITVTGTHLGGATVTVGGNPCTPVVVASDGLSLTCTLPAGSAGAKDVVVTTAGGTATLPGGYTYTTPTPAPTIGGVSPNSGPLAGGTTVTVTGTNLGGTTAVTVGGNACTSVVVAGDGLSLTCTLPAGTAGAKDVVVTTAGGTATLPGGYTYTTPPPAPAETSTGVGTAVQSVTLPIPAGGSVALVGGTDATHLTIPGQGAYLLDQVTGVVTFSPVSGFVGAATPATYRVTDAYGQASLGTYAPTVTSPTKPPQTLVHCGAVLQNQRNGAVVALPKRCVTDAGQVVRVAVRCKLAGSQTRGDISYCRKSTNLRGGVTIKVRGGTTVIMTVDLYCPATAKYAAYKKSRVYRVRGRW
ncbi:MAG: IPT/TIG domain-containing protein, partial [Actinomycetes bacterium]